MKIKILILTIFSLFIAGAFTSVAAGGSTGLAFLKIGAGARATAMGEAFTAVSDDASGLFWNPAGTAWMKSRQAHFTHSNWIQDITNEMASAVFPSKIGAIGISAALTNVGGIEQRTIASAEPLGEVSAHDVAFGVTYGRMFGKKLSIGVGARFLNEKIYLQDANGYSLDMGVRYRLLRGLFAGAVIQNVGSMSELSAETIKLPTTVRAGVAYRFVLSGITVVVASDVVKFLDGNDHINLGAEIRPIKLLALRFGYQSKYEERDLTAGFGLLLGSFYLDYAYVPFDAELGNTQRFSFSVNF